jgi:hypothetical protein
MGFAAGIGTPIQTPTIAEVIAVSFAVLSVSISTILIATIIYGRGNLRAFCIGAIVPLGLLQLEITRSLVVVVTRWTYRYDLANFESELRLLSVGAWFTAIFTGLLAVLVRTLLTSDEGSTA